MRGENGLTRRALLRCMVLLGAGARASAALVAPRAPRRPKRSCAGLLRRSGSAAAVGREYLRLHPEEANAVLLARRLGLPGPDLDAFAAGQTRRLEAEILRRHRDDFDCGRVVDFHGWILSATELRLYALVSLQSM